MTAGVNLQGGGDFNFASNRNRQGIEGYFINNKGISVPVSLKNLTSSNSRKVPDTIHKNAEAILKAENLPVSNNQHLANGTLQKTILHVQTPNITKLELTRQLKNYPIGGPSLKYKQIILDTKDGIIYLENGKITGR